MEINMKLKELNQDIFQINKEINFDVSPLYFDYAEKEIYELLKQNILTPGILHKGINIKPANENIGWKINEFLYMKNNEVTENYYHFFLTLINSVSELEKQNLLDLALEQSDKRFAAILLKNPQIKLTEKQFDSIFNNKSPDNFPLREVLIENKNIPLSVEQINQGLLIWDSGLNMVYAKRGDNCITKDTIDSLINETNPDPYWNDEVLVELLKNHDNHFTADQIESFLSNDNFKLKVECARNYNLPFTKEQIIRGINDEGFEYDAYDNTYEDYNPSDVILAFLYNPNITLPKEEINNILYGYDKERFIEPIVERSDLVLEEEQINYILEKNNRASVLMLKNENIHLNDQQLLKILYRDKHWPKYIAEFYLSRETVTVSDLVMVVLKAFPDEDIKKVISKKESMLLDKESEINTKKFK